MTPANPNTGIILVTQQAELIATVEQIVEKLGLELFVEPRVHSVASRWTGALFVLVGGDLAEECVLADLPRRRQVVLIHPDWEVGEGGGAPSMSNNDRERELWRSAVALGAENVVGLPSSEFWLIEQLDRIPKPDIRVGKTIACIPASGGSGCSTFAVNLGLRAVSQGKRAIVIDLDPCGGGIDLLLGAEEIRGTRWPEINPGSGRIAAETLAGAVPQVQGLAFLSHARGDFYAPTAEVVSAVIDAARRAFDVVIIDVSRGAETINEHVLREADSAAIVVRNHVRSVAAASVVNAWLRAFQISPRFVLASDSKGLGSADIAMAFGVDDILDIPFIPSMVTKSDEGEHPAMTSAYAQVCDRIMETVMPVALAGLK